MFLKKDKKQSRFTPADWSDVKGGCTDGYTKSKTLAEKAAWDFLEKLPENERFELVAINPGFVMGPALVKGTFSSADFINDMLLGRIPKMAPYKMPMVDVRNVAQAHLNALLKPDAAGKRFMLIDRSYWLKEMATILKDNFGDKFPKAANPNKTFSKTTVRILSLFIKQMKHMLASWGVDTVFVNDETRDILGIDFIPMSQSLAEMVPTLIENG